jgi:hypothetical protein
VFVDVKSFLMTPPPLAFSGLSYDSNCIYLFSESLLSLSKL